MLDLFDVGEAVKKARRDLKISRQDLAERAGVSRARLEHLENGRGGDFGVKKLVRVMACVGLDLRMTTLNQNRPTLDDLRASQSNPEERVTS